jgi:UDP-N-acetylglucosamine--N-acetylmuramyl-(pentapeptide) pyrophosphoryl-undecaprenol N-acetylglucosamine transferase
MSLSVVLAGGGTAGHVEPALALADALLRRDPSTVVTALGTATGLEARLVPARGYALAEIPRVPLPRRPTVDLLRVPGRVAGAVRQTQAHLERVDADVVVGFGGYVALPGYLAARRRRTPLVVHEANARAGLANRVGARLTPYVAAAVDGSGLPGAQVLGIPLRTAVSRLDRAAARAEARAAFGLSEGPVLLVTGGSQGARNVNAAVIGASQDLAAAGVQVLHVAGPKNAEAVQAQVSAPTHKVLAYVDRMELAYAAADLAVCRAGPRPAPNWRPSACRRSTCRCPSATASRRSTRALSSRPGEACSSTTPTSGRRSSAGRCSTCCSTSRDS